MHLGEHDIEVVASGGRLTAELDAASIAIEAEAETLALRAQASGEVRLEEVVGFLALHLREFTYPHSPDIAWAGLSADRLFSDFREMQVVRVEDITPHMRRVTLTGNDLARFASDANLHVRLFFAPEGREPVWPTRGPDGLTRPIEPECRPFVRKYTIRRVDPDKSEVDIDFVLHADAGPGSDWAKRATPGDLIGMAGPGGRTAKPAGWMLLAGDETALPAIARILESLPSHTKGHAIIEIAGPDERMQLEGPGGMSIEWILRTGASSALHAAVIAIPVPEGSSRFCWAAAEFDTIQAIRRHWRDHCALGKDEQLAVAYWRRGSPLD